MRPLDFTTALGLLLSDGMLRDDFNANPHIVLARLNLRKNDYDAFSKLSPDDLEFQAKILIRKRFVIVQNIVPETFRILGGEAWQQFHAYARANRKTPEQTAHQDAECFCRYLLQIKATCLFKAELNRLRFILSKSRFAIHAIRHKQGKHAVQLFLRFGKHHFREVIFYFGL